MSAPQQPAASDGSPQPRRQQPRLIGVGRRLLRSRQFWPLLAAIGVQTALLLATAWILVFAAAPEPVRFTPVDTTATPRALERQALLAQMARLQTAAPPDVFVVAPLDDISQTDFNVSESLLAATTALSAALTSPPAAAEPTALSIGTTASHWSAATDALEAVNAVRFFGIEEQAERYLILIDTSNSMFVRSRSGTRYRYNFGQIKEETTRLIDELNANTLFNLILYEGGAKAWQENLQPATAKWRKQAAQWVHAIGENPSLSIRDRRGDGPLLQEGGGTRLDTALKLAFSHYDPQVVFIVTDGEINSIPGGRIREEALVEQLHQLQAAQLQPARVHVIHYQTAQMREVELQTMQAIARQGRGKFVQIIAQEY